MISGFQNWFRNWWESQRYRWNTPPSYEEGRFYEIEPSEGLKPAKRNLLWASVGAIVLGLTSTAPPSDGGPIKLELSIVGSKTTIDKGALVIGLLVYLVFLYVRFRHEIRLTRIRNHEAYIKHGGESDLGRGAAVARVLAELEEHVTAINKQAYTCTFDFENIPSNINGFIAHEDHWRKVFDEKTKTIDELGRIMIDQMTSIDQLTQKIDGGEVGVIDPMPLLQISKKLHEAVQLVSKSSSQYHSPSDTNLSITLSDVKNAASRIEKIHQETRLDADKYLKLASEIDNADTAMFLYHDRATGHVMFSVAFAICLVGNAAPILLTLDALPETFTTWWQTTASAWDSFLGATA